MSLKDVFIVREMGRPIKGASADDRVIFSDVKMDKLLDFDYTKQKVGLKPGGVWYSIGDEWADLISGEYPDWAPRYSFVHRITVDDSKFLKMSTLDELVKFTEKYQDPDPYRNALDTKFVDWAHVAEDYAGIEVNPYIPAARYDRRTLWYGGWDVASGCVWDINLIKSVEFLGEMSDDDWRNVGSDEYVEN